jgi:malonate-semialdehyde dehydrogenase (acetylating)/methylmalonate-semialdehyde dehydrogenase
VGTALVTHPDIDGVTFLGSTPIARAVFKECGRQGKRVLAQGGAKNYVVVMPDADIERTVAAMLTSFYGCTGQRCLSGANAIIVGPDDGFYHALVRRFIEIASDLTIGYGLDPSVQMGPLQSAERKARVVDCIEQGEAEGAELSLDGRAVEIQGSYSDTCFLGPSVFESVEPGMRIAREEIFGPVASILRSDTFEEALEVVNSSPFGNAASIFTSSGRVAREFQHRVQCGNIGVNIGVPAPMAFFPFGGMKDSFFGVLHGQGRDAIRFFTEKKIVIQRWF